MKKTVEFYAGTESFSKVMRAHGYSTFTLDNDPRFGSDYIGDIRQWKPTHDLLYPDILWASPPCQGFSVAVIGRNWNHDRTPKTDSARLAMELAQRALFLVNLMGAKWWFIENPSGMLKKMPWMDEFLRQRGGVMVEVWYCHYGDTRAKPTNIWTNALWWKPQPICHNRKPNHPTDCCCRDHVAASRGARTGTQGLKGAMERGRIPPALFEEILAQMPA